MEAALQLDKIARSVHLIEVTSKLNADEILIERASSSPKVKIWTNTRVTEINGR